MISREDMTSLIWLRMHWENYYQISLDDGLWRALPVGGSADCPDSEERSAAP